VCVCVHKGGGTCQAHVCVYKGCVCVYKRGGTCQTQVYELPMDVSSD